MLKALWTKLLATRSNKTLSDILKDPFHREGFLGIRRDLIPTPERIIRDNDKVINYARSEDYAVWANEAWMYVLECIDKLCDSKLEPQEVDFYRGGLSKTIDNLRISYKALQAKEQAIEISRNNK